jgi:hypothetical protein
MDVARGSSHAIGNALENIDRAALNGQPVRQKRVQSAPEA